jgi:hypothetical protein
MSSPGFAAWLATTPLWLIALTLLLAMALSGLLGNLLRWRHLRRQGDGGGGESEAKAEGGFMLSSVLGLLALLIGFTFALAVDRFETRRALVLEEANAIGTAYLRSQLLEEPYRSRISELLVEYTDNRLELARMPDAQARNHVARNDRLVNQLWVETVAAWPTIRGIDFSSAYLDSMNAVIDLNESRKISRQAKVPAEVYLVLFVYLITTAALVGYTRKTHRERLSALFLFLLLTMALMLIIDIDRPAAGGINESQRAMEDLQASLRATPPGFFDRPAAQD